MPDPRELAQLIGDPRFQELSAPDQHSTLRGYLHESDEEFRGFAGPEQQQIVSGLIEHNRPTFASKVADVAEYVPVVGGAISGYRAAEAGEPARPLTSAISGGYEATSPTGRALQEAGRDVAELAAVGGVTALARPALARVAARVAGGTLETAAPGLLGRLTGGVAAETMVDKALGSATSQVAERIAGGAAKASLRQRIVERGLTELTAGELFGLTNAIERGVSGGEPAPLEDFVATPLGIAALGTAFFGLGGIARKLGMRNIQPLVEDLARRDPEAMARYQGDAARVIDAVTRSSGGRLSKEGAADVVFNAVREPLTQQGDIKVLKDTLRQHPEILDSELGLHLLRTQRERITAPEVRTTASPGLRVTYDDEAGRTVTELLSDVGAQKAFAKRVEAGRVVVDNAAGDETSILRSGVRAGTILEERVAPGGGTARLRPEGEAVVAGEPGKFFESQLPVLRPDDVQLRAELDGAAAELRASPIRGVPEPTMRSLSDQAASPEAISRLRAERASNISYAAVDVRGKGRERVVPGTVDRVDTRPGPYEVMVKRGATERDVIVEAGAKVTPQQLAKVRVAEMQRFREDVAARQLEGRQPLLESNPNVDYGTLPDGDIVVVPKPGTTRVAAPPPGTVTRSARGTQVRVLSEPDPVGRVLIEDESGRRIRANVRGGIVDAHESLFDGLPTRTAPSVTLPGAFEPEMKRVVQQRIAEQVRPGQLIHQTLADMHKRGVRPSIEVLAVDADRALVRSGEQVMEVPRAQIESTIEEGIGKFAFDMTVKGEAALEAQAERFNAWMREAPTPARRVDPEALARDVQMADELFTFDRSHGQRAGPSTLARDSGDGLAAKTRERQNRPADERTKGGNALIKGCKP